jgi:hypothetical protein
MGKQRAKRGSKHDPKLNIESWRLVNQFAQTQRQQAITGNLVWSNIEANIN